MPHRYPTRFARRTFRFLDLPLKLRQNIYRYVVTDVVHVVLKGEASLRYKHWEVAENRTDSAMLHLLSITQNNVFIRSVYKSCIPPLGRAKINRLLNNHCSNARMSPVPYWVAALPPITEQSSAFDKSQYASAADELLLSVQRLLTQLKNVEAPANPRRPQLQESINYIAEARKSLGVTPTPYT